MTVRELVETWGVADKEVEDVVLGLYCADGFIRSCAYGRKSLNRLGLASHLLLTANERFLKQAQCEHDPFKERP